jgi:hypothetical protein
LEKTGRVIVGDTEGREQTEEIRIEGASKIETVNCETDEGIEATRPFFGIPASGRLFWKRTVRKQRNRTVPMNVPQHAGKCWMPPLSFGRCEQ